VDSSVRLERRDLESLFTASFAELNAGDLGLPADIWNEEFFRANELINLYTDFQVCALLDRLGLAGGVLEGGGFPESRRDSIDWLLGKASGSALARKGPPPAGYGPWLKRVILDEHPDLAPCLDLVDLAASGFPAFRARRAMAGRSSSPRRPTPCGSATSTRRTPFTSRSTGWPRAPPRRPLRAMRSGSSSWAPAAGAAPSLSSRSSRTIRPGGTPQRTSPPGSCGRRDRGSRNAAGGGGSSSSFAS
jgi:hypothetical protein